jgi:hypothetical protein
MLPGRGPRLKWTLVGAGATAAVAAALALVLITTPGYPPPPSLGRQGAASSDASGFSAEYAWQSRRVPSAMARAAEAPKTDREILNQRTLARQMMPADRAEAPQTVGGVGPLIARTASMHQGSEDVTTQSVDLDARLTNARRTEQRLAMVLEQRTGRLSDVLEVEREIARVRGEIEQMDSERKRLTNRIEFATIDLRLEEERHAGFSVSPPSVRTELRNAAVDGVRTAADFMIGLTLGVLRAGPLVAIWIAALAWPAWALWRRRRSTGL